MEPITLAVIKKVAGNILGVSLKYPFQIATGILLVTNMSTCNSLHNAQAALTKEKAAHVLDITNFKNAQTEANAKAAAAKAALIKEGRHEADQADQNYSALLKRYNANLLRYKASQSGSIRPGNYQLPTAQGGDGSSSSPEVSEGQIVIDMGDAQICAVNTARLQAVHDWALALPKQK